MYVCGPTAFVETVAAALVARPRPYPVHAEHFGPTRRINRPREPSRSSRNALGGLLQEVPADRSHRRTPLPVVPSATRPSARIACSVAPTSSCAARVAATSRLVIATLPDRHVFRFLRHISRSTYRVERHRREPRPSARGILVLARAYLQTYVPPAGRAAQHDFREQHQLAMPEAQVVPLPIAAPSGSMSPHPDRPRTLSGSRRAAPSVAVLVVDGILERRAAIRVLLRRLPASPSSRRSPARALRAMARRSSPRSSWTCACRRWTASRRKLRGRRRSRRHAIVSSIRPEALRRRSRRSSTFFMQADELGAHRRSSRSRTSTPNSARAAPPAIRTSPNGS